MKPFKFPICSAIAHAIDPSARVNVDATDEIRLLDEEFTKSLEGSNVHYRTSECIIPHDALVTRDLTVAGDPSLVGEEPQTFIDLLRGKLISTRVGIPVISGLKGDLPFPIVSGDAANEWQPEGTAATQAAPTVNRVTGTPFRLTSYVDVTAKLIKTGGTAADKFVMTQLASNARRLLDKAVFHGAGPASNEPTGIPLTSGVGSVSGANMDYDRLVEFETDVCESNADGDGDSEMFFVLRPTDRSLLKKRPREAGLPAYLCNDDNRIAGYRSVGSTIINAGSMFFGNFAGVYILLWGNGVNLLINPYSLDKTGMVRVVFDLYVGVIVTQPAAISYASDLS